MFHELEYLQIYKAYNDTKIQDICTHLFNVSPENYANVEISFYDINRPSYNGKVETYLEQTRNYIILVSKFTLEEFNSNKGNT